MSNTVEAVEGGQNVSSNNNNYYYFLCGIL